MTDDQRVARLERRLARERTAREAAEAVADRRMRELWLTNQELDKRVAERTEELERALARLEATTRATEGFVSNLSHEMLTPLNAVTGMLEAIGADTEDPTTTARLTTAAQGADQLQYLISRLIGLMSRHTSTSSVTTTLAQLGEDLAERWRLQALSRRQLLTVDVDHTISEAPIELDRQRFDRIIDELVSNAVHHTEPGVIAVSLKLDDGETTTLVAAVTDGGPGFEPADRTTLVEALERVDTSPSRRNEGIGIGLPLAYELVSSLDGQIELTSAPGSATTATLRIPVTDL